MKVINTKPGDLLFTNEDLVLLEDPTNVGRSYAMRKKYSYHEQNIVPVGTSVIFLGWHKVGKSDLMQSVGEYLFPHGARVRIWATDEVLMCADEWERSRELGMCEQTEEDKDTIFSFPTVVTKKVVSCEEEEEDNEFSFPSI